MRRSFKSLTSVALCVALMLTGRVFGQRRRYADSNSKRLHEKPETPLSSSNAELTPERGRHWTPSAPRGVNRFFSHSTHPSNEISQRSQAAPISSQPQVKRLSQSHTGLSRRERITSGALSTTKSRTFGRKTQEKNVVRGRLSFDTRRRRRLLTENFVSVGLMSGLVFRGWKNLDFDSRKLKTLAKALSPALIRMGGTRGDYLYFTPTAEFHSKPPTIKTPMGKMLQEFPMTDLDWDKLNLFSDEVRWNLVFQLSVLHRKGNRTSSRWDPSNAMELLEYNEKRGYSVDFTLGNEPPFDDKSNYSLSPEQLGDDFRALRSLLDSWPYYRHKSLVCGPDIDFNPGKSKIMDWLIRFLASAGDALGAVTFHHYYVHAHVARLDDYVRPKILNKFVDAVRGIKEILGWVPTDLPIWLTETSSAKSGGKRGITDRFVAGFMWMDKMGVAAAEGVDVLFRNSFYDAWYSLLDDNMEPMPDYWLTLLHKRLMGQIVLAVDVEEEARRGGRRRGDGTLRFYAHCVNPASSYDHGAIVLMGMNLENSKIAQISIPKEFRSQRIDEFLLTAGKGGLVSREVRLNQVVLKLVDDSTIPNIQPRSFVYGGRIHVPPLAMGFWVLPQAKVDACVASIDQETKKQRTKKIKTRRRKNSGEWVENNKVVFRP